jgi:hypothetical protein
MAFLSPVGNIPKGIPYSRGLSFCASIFLINVKDKRRTMGIQPVNLFLLKRNKIKKHKVK